MLEPVKVFVRGNIAKPLLDVICKFVDTAAGMARGQAPKNWEALVVANPKDTRAIKETILVELTVDLVSILSEAIDKIIDTLGEQMVLWRRFSFDLVDGAFVQKVGSVNLAPPNAVHPGP